MKKSAICSFCGRIYPPNLDPGTYICECGAEIIIMHNDKVCKRSYAKISFPVLSIGFFVVMLSITAFYFMNRPLIGQMFSSVFSGDTEKPIKVAQTEDIEKTIEVAQTEDTEKPIEVSQTEDSEELYNQGLVLEEAKRYEEAIKYYQKAAEKNHQASQHALGMYYESKGDFLQALGWYERSATQGNRNSAICVIRCYEKQGRDADARKFCEKLVEIGSFPELEYKLGCYYRDGLAGVIRNQEAALMWFNKAAANEHPESMYIIGHYYFEDKKFSEAVKWFRKSAELGNPTGQCYLGRCYYEGEGVEKDFPEAVKWFRKSAEQGNVDAQHYLGSCYYEGRGIEKDFFEAVKWFRKSAEQGDPVGQRYLGVCYYEGEGVEKDFSEAVKWFCKSAEQGDPVGQRYLGVCYYRGKGVEKDFFEAVKWFRKSAALGDPIGQCYLGMCYHKGEGVKKNFSEAVEWFRKSAEQGNMLGLFCLGYCYYDGEGVAKDCIQAGRLHRKFAEFAENNDSEIKQFGFKNGNWYEIIDIRDKKIEKVLYFAGFTEKPGLLPDELRKRILTIYCLFFTEQKLPVDIITIGISPNHLEKHLQNYVVNCSCQSRKKKCSVCHGRGYNIERIVHKRYGAANFNQAVADALNSQRRVTCTMCGGKKTIIYSSKKGCEKCNYRGWILNLSALEHDYKNAIDEMIKHIHTNR